jgi:hypothetical protein
MPYACMLCPSLLSATTCQWCDVCPALLSATACQRCVWYHVLYICNAEGGFGAWAECTVLALRVGLGASLSCWRDQLIIIMIEKECNSNSMSTQATICTYPGSLGQGWNVHAWSKSSSFVTPGGCSEGGNLLVHPLHPLQSARG